MIMNDETFQGINLHETGPDFFIKDLKSYLSSSRYSDVRIYSSESSSDPLFCHSSILAAVSPFLKDLLLQSNPEGNLISFVIPEYSFKDLESFLRLSYTGVCHFNKKENLESLSSLCDTLKVTPDIMDRVKTNPTVTITPVGFLSNHKIESEITKKSFAQYSFNLPSSVTIEPLKNKTFSQKKSLKRSSDIVNVQIEKIKVDRKKVGPPVRLPPTLALTQGLLTPTQKREADLKTREMLGRTNESLDAVRKFERCKCVNCINPNKKLEKGETTFHICHYPHCAKKYKKTSHLRAHLRAHVGDQPFLCSWSGCGRRFTRSDELHRHYRIHTGEKKHRCTDCDKCFSRSDHLKKHLSSHAHGNVNSQKLGQDHSAEQFSLEEFESIGSDFDPLEFLEVKNEVYDDNLDYS